MDEPTSSLSQKETETLFEVVKGLRDEGISVIYISHRLGRSKGTFRPGNRISGW